MHQKSSEYVPLDFFTVYQSKKRKHWDCQVDRKVLIAFEALKGCLVGHVSVVHCERRAKAKPVSRWRGSGEWRKTKKNCWRPWTCGTPHRWEKPWRALSIKWQNDNVDVQCCKWSEWSPERNSQVPFSLQGINVTAYSIWEIFPYAKKFNG